MHASSPLHRCSAPCPLCFSPVVARELRLVRARPVAAAAKVGDMLSLQLLHRNRGSILPEPVVDATAVTAVGTPAVTAAAVTAAGPSGDRAPVVASGVDTCGAAAATAKTPMTAAAALTPTSKPGWSALPPVTKGSEGSGAAAADDASARCDDLLLANIFARFALIGDATALWREAAQELAAYAAQVIFDLGASRPAAVLPPCPAGHD